jgi:hypothetical protein
MLMGLVLVGNGCQPQGPAEKAGESLDNAASNAADALNPKGPMEKAGEKVDNAINR